MKNYQTKLSQDAIQGLHDCIETLIATPADTDDDKLLFANLATVKGVLYKKIEYKLPKITSITFKPHEAIALRILYTDYLQDNTTFLGNHLHRISNEVNQFYQ